MILLEVITTIRFLLTKVRHVIINTPTPRAAAEPVQEKSLDLLPRLAPTTMAKLKLKPKINTNDLALSVLAKNALSMTSSLSTKGAAASAALLLILGARFP